MQEKIISFKTAKLAKEVGFNKKVLFSYEYSDKKSFLYCGGILYKSAKLYGYIQNIGYDLYNYNSHKKLNEYSAPTQSELQAWIRKKHNIHISVNPYNNTNQYSVHVYNIILSEENNLDYEFNETYNSYEEALEQGLLKALKFIK
jgi:hypothetical protein